jgi:hypothetical protein
VVLVIISELGLNNNSNEYSMPMINALPGYSI